MPSRQSSGSALQLQSNLESKFNLNWLQKFSLFRYNFTGKLIGTWSQSFPVSCCHKFWSCYKFWKKQRLQIWSPSVARVLAAIPEMKLSHRTCQWYDSGLAATCLHAGLGVVTVFLLVLTALLLRKADFEVWTYDTDNSTRIKCFMQVEVVLCSLR